MYRIGAKRFTREWNERRSVQYRDLQAVLYVVRMQASVPFTLDVESQDINAMYS